MLSKLTVRENQPGEFSVGGIARDYMKVHMPVPIHQEGIVEVIWLEKR